MTPSSGWLPVTFRGCLEGKKALWLCFSQMGSLLFFLILHQKRTKAFPTASYWDLDWTEVAAPLLDILGLWLVLRHSSAVDTEQSIVLMLIHLSFFFFLPTEWARSWNSSREWSCCCGRCWINQMGIYYLFSIK